MSFSLDVEHLALGEEQSSAHNKGMMTTLEIYVLISQEKNKTKMDFFVRKDLASRTRK